jgi:hypothetical protein
MAHTRHPLASGGYVISNIRLAQYPRHGFFVRYSADGQPQEVSSYGVFPFASQFRKASKTQRGYVLAAMTAAAKVALL